MVRGRVGDPEDDHHFRVERLRRRGLGLEVGLGQEHDPVHARRGAGSQVADPPVRVGAAPGQLVPPAAVLPAEGQFQPGGGPSRGRVQHVRRDAHAVVMPPVVAGTVIIERPGQPEPDDLHELVPDHLALGRGIVAQPGLERGQHAGRGHPGRADQEHVPEPFLVGGVAGPQRRPARPRGRPGRRTAPGATRPPRSPRGPPRLAPVARSPRFRAGRRSSGGRPGPARCPASPARRSRRRMRPRARPACRRAAR